ncbi:MAG: hypothetical protein M5R36_16660 [Deltaproteobacteria bacterium]|nr:hypothetical protein [Deltaproteobacteria bacterium]
MERIFWLLAYATVPVLMSVAVAACGDDDDDDDDDDDADDDADDDVADDDEGDDDGGECSDEEVCEFATDCGGFASVEQCLEMSSPYDDETCSPGYEACVCDCWEDGLASGDCETYSDCGASCFFEFC